jgi:type IV secretory pathway TrbF-like protein
MKNSFVTKSAHENANPYLKGSEGKRLWDDRYMNMNGAIKRWQLAFFMSSLIVLVLIFSLVKVSKESHVEPFVVETNEGMPYAIKAMNPTSLQDEKIINFAINQFIINTRTVLSDPKAEELLLTKSYAYGADSALETLQDYFEKNNPYQIAQKYTVSVNIINAMPLSDHTWQVTWDEIQHFQSNSEPSVTTRWMANVSYKLGEVNPKFMNDNPFGLYMTDITWSQSQTH